MWEFYIASTFFCFCITLIIKELCTKTNLLCNPNDRSSHSVPKPRLGGLGVISTFLLFSNVPKFLILSLLVLLVVGIVDDVFDISPKLKLLGQLISSMILALNDIYLVLPFVPNEVSIIVSIVWMVSILNAMNFIDGLDGLFSGYSIISLVFLLISISIFLIDYEYFNIGVLLFCLIGFLLLNSYPSSIFLGDCGSLTIGLLLIYFVISVFPQSWFVSIGLFLFPLVDLISVVIKRITNGLSIFAADKRHLHHVLYKITNRSEHTFAVLCLYSIMILVNGCILSIYILFL